jgi:uncharacterized RDD family membrane protein YckC
LNPAIDTIITAETPEGIAISIRPAGFAVRCSAFLIDLLIRWTVLLFCIGTLASAGHFGNGLVYIALFVVNWLYAVIFEMTAAAATPGKRIMGIYVVMASGLPITPAGCLIRNLLRAVDFLPLFYAFGAISMLLRHDERRLGDLAAGTVVAYRNDTPPAEALAEAEPLAPTVALSRRQQAAITAFAWRSRRLTSQRADEIAEFAAWAAPNSAKTGAAGSLTARLLGVARWLHGERRPPARTEQPE